MRIRATVFKFDMYLKWQLIGVCVLLIGNWAEAQKLYGPQDRWHLVRSFGKNGGREGELEAINSIAVGPSGEILVGDRNRSKVVVFNQNGEFLREWTVNYPTAIAVDSKTNVYVGVLSGTVTKYSINGSYLQTIAHPGSGDGQLDDPHGIAIGPDGDIYVSDSGNNRIQVFNSQGVFLRKWGGKGAAPGDLNYQGGIVFDEYGYLHVADGRNRRVQVFDGAGTYLRHYSVANNITVFDLAISPDAFLVLNGQFTTYGGGELRRLFYGNSGESAFWGGSLVIGSGSTVRVYRRGYRTKGQAFYNSPPLPKVHSILQHPRNGSVNVEFEVLESDDPQVEVRALAFLGGLPEFDYVRPIRTLLGDSVIVPGDIPANTKQTISWNALADLGEIGTNLSVRILARDSRTNLLDLHFLTLPIGDTNSLTISRSPLLHRDFEEAWFWLLAGDVSSVRVDNGQVMGVGGDFDGQVLAATVGGVNTTTVAGRSYLLGRMGLVEATPNQLQTAREASSSGSVSTFAVLRDDQVMPDLLPKNANEYGFDTGSYSSEAVWVVPAP